MIYIPYPSFKLSAQALGKDQLIAQINFILFYLSSSHKLGYYPRHMWGNYLPFLAEYGLICCEVYYENTGQEHTFAKDQIRNWITLSSQDFKEPWWWDVGIVHQCHRDRLGISFTDGYDNSRFLDRTSFVYPFDSLEHTKLSDKHIQFEKDGRFINALIRAKIKHNDLNLNLLEPETNFVYTKQYILIRN